MNEIPWEQFRREIAAMTDDAAEFYLRRMYPNDADRLLSMIARRTS